MSDHSGDQLSRGSSQSLFSVFGTSSVSCPSESGHVNVEELSVDQLELALGDAKNALKLAILETLMFESYFERLAFAHEAGRRVAEGGGSRKASATWESDPTSDTDSATGAGISLLEVSRAPNPKKRSGSRTGSLGQRGKSLRLSLEQKCGMAHQEQDRITQDLRLWKRRYQADSRHFMATVDERVIKLDECTKQKVLLLQAASKASLSPRRYDHDRVQRLLRDEIRRQERGMSKLAIQSGVIRDQCRVAGRRLQTWTKASEESGPVDLEQLELENAEHAERLQAQGQILVRLRQRLAQTRRRKQTGQKRLELERNRASQLQTRLAQIQFQMAERARPRPTPRAQCLRRSKSEIAPTAEEYVSLKLAQLRPPLRRGPRPAVEGRTGGRKAPEGLPEPAEIRPAPKLIRGTAFNLTFHIAQGSRSD